MCCVVLVIGPYTKAANASASVYAFPWMAPISTTSFILIVRSFTCLINHDMEPIFYLRTDASKMCRCDGDVICIGHDLNW